MIGERRTWQSDALTAARRLLEAARVEKDVETRRSLERAALKYLAKARRRDAPKAAAVQAGAQNSNALRPTLWVVQ